MLLLSRLVVGVGCVAAIQDDRVHVQGRDRSLVVGHDRGVVVDVDREILSRGLAGERSLPLRSEARRAVVGLFLLLTALDLVQVDVQLVDVEVVRDLRVDGLPLGPLHVAVRLLQLAHEVVLLLRRLLDLEAVLVAVRRQVVRLRLDLSQRPRVQRRDSRLDRPVEHCTIFGRAEESGRGNELGGRN